MSDTRWKLGQLDALRGIAILGVMFVHSASISGRFDWQSHLGMVMFTGQRGVELFYMVSAFTLALSNDRRRSERFQTLNFFLRRFFRIAPLFYLSVLATGLIFPRYRGTWLSALPAVLFVNGFHPVYATVGAIGCWSVADETIFYMLLPLLFRVIRSTRAAIIAVAGTAILSRILIHVLLRAMPQYQLYWTFVSMIAQLPVFLTGLAAYFVWRDLREGLTGAAETSLALWLLGVAGVVCVMSLPFSDWNMVSTCLALSMFLLALMLRPWPLFVNRVTIFLGKISFSLYLLHFYVNEAILRYFDAHPVRSPVVQAAETLSLLLLFSVPIAFVTWHLVERPGMQLGARCIGWLERRKPDTEAVPPLLSEKDSVEAQI